MEQVVKEISHLFQFFPDEIPPLEYPNQSDLIEAGGKIFCEKLIVITFYIHSGHVEQEPAWKVVAVTPV